LKEELFISALGFGGLGPLSFGSVFLCLWVRHYHHGGKRMFQRMVFTTWQTGSRERQEGARARYTLQRHTPSDPLPPVRPQLPKLPAPPKIVAPAVDQVLNT
jgi:hypothetical protein